MTDGFPDIATLKHLQMLEASCWQSRSQGAIPPASLTSDGPELTWLRSADCSYLDEQSVPAYQKHLEADQSAHLDDHSRS